MNATAISVVRGRPTDAELAAVIAVLAAAAAPAPDADASSAAAGPARPSAWADRSRTWYARPRPGPSAWRASALPH